MERATKLLVVGWVLVALAVKLWLVRGVWPGLPTYVVAMTCVSAGLVAFDRRAVAVPLVFAYLFPALIAAGHGRYHVDFTELWLGPVIGAMLPDALRSSWHIPLRWRRALITWALIVAVAVPLVIVREMDFYPALFLKGMGLSFTARWELHVGLVAMAGILWFDWLCGEGRPDFARWIATPLAVSAGLMSVAAIYQGFGEMTFLNNTLYGALRRASGTVLDANVCGTIAALWMGGGLLLAPRVGRWRRPLSVAIVAVGWMAVWMTGSRTAFAAATIVSLFAGAMVWADRPATTSRRISWPALMTAAVAIALGIVVLTVTPTRLQGGGPLARVLDTLPSPSVSGYRAFAAEMWNRDGYGKAATEMIREHPLVGVGLGAFHGLASEFANDPNVTPDNAQNWYRHWLAELGVIGSLGWMEWTATFVLFLFHRRSDRPRTLWALRGILVAFGIISMLGVPGQEAPVIITFWTLASWYIQEAGEPQPIGRLGRVPLAFVGLVVLLFAVGTVRVGTSSLRPPVRAQRAGRLYTYGYHQAEPRSDGGVQRWTERRLARTYRVNGLWLALTISVNHLDLATRPVDAKVWADGELVVNAHLTTADPLTTYIGVRPGGQSGQSILIETEVNRVLRPRDFGVPDDCELGLLVAGHWVSKPPEGASTAIAGHMTERQ